MKISDSDICVAYYFKQKRSCIAGPIEAGDSRFDLEYLKNYVLHLINKAKKTRKQQYIKYEIESSTSKRELLDIVDRVIAYGDVTEFKDYYGTLTN